jgi:DNA transposition AAA+ family ATPase
MKTRVKKALEDLVARKGSQAKAAASLRGVSSATISLILSGKGEEVRESMWLNLQEQLLDKKQMAVAETAIYNEMTTLLKSAQEDRLVMSLVANAGSGKTFTSKQYEVENKEVYRVACSEFWTKNDFVDELLRSLGESSDGYSKKERINRAIEVIKRKRNPLIIFDEFDKLNDNVWFFFITLYNELEDKCGMVLLSTDYIRFRIEKGLRLNKRGYNEFWSRLGRRCIKLEPIAYEDIKAVCEANGISNSSAIEDIARDSEGDLRRVARKIYSSKKNA